MDNMNSFIHSGFITKKGAPSGEGAKFNVMPPGDMIDNQPDADIRDLPMKQIVGLSYPGDGQ